MYQAIDVFRYPKNMSINSFRFPRLLEKRINPISSDKKLIIDTSAPKVDSVDETPSPEFSLRSSLSNSSSDSEMSLSLHEPHAEPETKIQTCPNLAMLTPDIDATSIELSSPIITNIATKGQDRIKRAATWLGLASQKLLASPNVLGQIKKLTWPTEQVEELVYGTDMDHVHYLQNQINAAPKTNAPQRIMYCRVMQIINLSSSRECEYELQIQLNNSTLSSKRGIMQKIKKDMSADVPYDDPLVFEIEEPFSLNFVVAARHTNTKIRENLAKFGIWPLQTRSTSQLPIVGYSCLSFENKMDVLEHGVSRFRLTKSTNKPAYNIELLIDIEVKDITPVPQLSESQQIVNSIKHCQKGDYLTVYSKTTAHPVWKRYWCVLENDQLIMHDFFFKENKEPVSCITMSSIKSVTQPTLDDCEQFGVSRKTGVVFDLNTSQEGKVYLYADTDSNAIHWRKGLSSYILLEKNTQKDNKQVDLQFIW